MAALIVTLVGGSCQPQPLTAPEPGAPSSARPWPPYDYAAAADGTERLATPLAIPRWTSTLAAILLVLLVQVAGFAGFLAFVVLHGRSQPGFIPIRDYVHFVDSLRPLAGGAKEQ